MFTEYLDNKYVSTGITLMLALYAALLGPELPKVIRDLFSNTIFRIAVLFMVVVRGNKDPKMAIMIAIAFVLTLDYLYAMDAKEAFQTVEYMNNNEDADEDEEQQENFADYEDSDMSETEENFANSEEAKETQVKTEEVKTEENNSCTIPVAESMMEYTGEMEYAQV